MMMTETSAATDRGGRRRLRVLLTALAAIVAILAGYAVWTNVRPYTHWLHADTLPMFRAMDAALAREVAD